MAGLEHWPTCFVETQPPDDNAQLTNGDKARCVSPVSISPRTDPQGRNRRNPSYFSPYFLDFALDRTYKVGTRILVPC